MKRRVRGFYMVLGFSFFGESKGRLGPTNVVVNNGRAQVVTK